MMQLWARTAGQLLVLTLAALVSACASTLAPPLPTPGPVAHLPPIAESAITVHLDADYAAMSTAANSAVPAKIVDMSGVNLGYGVTFKFTGTRSNIIVSRVAGGVGFTTSVHVDGTLDNPCIVIIRCTGTLAVDGQVWGQASPTINPDWSINLAPSGRYVIEDADVNLPFVPGPISVQVPLTQALQGPFYKLIGQINAEVTKSVLLKTAAQSAWSELGHPIEVSASPEVWLVVNPQRLLTEQPSITDQGVGLDVALIAKPELIVGDKPPDQDPGPLPNLTLVTTLPDQLSLYLPVQITYENATALAEQDLIGKELQAGNGITVSIDHISIFNNGDEVGVKLAFHAKSGIGWAPSGFVYLLGTPVYNLDNGYIAVTNLHFDIKTHDTLLALASWLEHQTLLDDLQSRLRIDIRDQVAARKQDLEKAIGAISLTSNVSASGQITSLAPSAVYLMQNGLQVNVVVLGSLAVTAR